MSDFNCFLGFPEFLYLFKFFTFESQHFISPSVEKFFSVAILSHLFGSRRGHH